MRLLCLAWLALLPQQSDAKSFKKTTVAGIHVFHLSGTNLEIGKHAGKLAPRAAAKDGIVPFIGQLVHRTVERAYFVRRNSWSKLFLPAFLRLRYYGPMIRKIPSEDLDFIHQLADGMGFPRLWMERAFVNPDVIHHVIADFYDRPSQRASLPGVVSARWGCSSFVALEGKTGTKDVIFARTQDYPGVGIWDKYPAIYYIKKPGRYAYATFGSVGMAVGAITAMNETGLTMAVHSAIAYEPNRVGSPLLTTTRKMIEGAKTIEEATQICNAHPISSGWIIPIADIKNGKGRTARIEVNSKAKKCTVKFSQNDFMATTNHLIEPQNEKDEIKFGPAVDHESRERLAHLRNVVGRKAKLDVRSAMQILADRTDLRLGRPMSYPPSGISTADQLMSVILLPKTGEIWMSNGQSPPASKGSYVRFRFRDLAKWTNIQHSQVQPVVSVLKGTPHQLSQWPAYPHYKRAYVAITNNVDYAAGLRHLNEAVKAEPAEPVYLFMRGMLHLRLNKLTEANRDLARTLGGKSLKNLDPHRLGVAQLYLAKSYDALGDRTLALAHYRTITKKTSLYRGLRQAAARYIQEPFSLDDLAGIEPDLKLVDSIGYEE